MVEDNNVECVHPNEPIKVDDFVVATRDIADIQKMSVGLVKEISGNKIIVYFIGKNKVVETNRGNVSFLDIKKTGKPYKMKICNICHILKEDMKDFEINQTDAKGRKTTRPSCRECRKMIDGVAMKSSEKKRLDAMAPKGIFTCPICQKTTIVEVTANLVKDHDHLTGKGREWICDSCNTGLGRFKDDINLLKRAINYLKKYS
ncbi:Recombination endonuclease VII [Candidatus Methanoperedenaceae archaeon GB50]|nr:Recombination endonuclease VII [Candidatus Methanoperedenaceae archaeon GB37]CAD7772627.1 Recombination endonuclease VII [Candidatus Methanoperedenaceae archaeon GB50]